MKKSKIILVVDDEKLYRVALVTKLILEGFSALGAKNSEEALKIAIQKKPDLILLDLVMSKMNGVEMLRELRAHNDYGKSVPVIILTQSTSAVDNCLEDLIPLKPRHLLEKTQIKLSELIAKIKECLK